MQKQMEEAQKNLEESEFTGTAGGGAVKVTMTGARRITKMEIMKDAVDPEDVETLEDLVMAAVNSAMDAIDEASQSTMSKYTGGFGF